MILVPRDTPGLQILRNLPVFGYVDQEGHAELVFEDVRVPASNLISEEGHGFLIAQARLGPGRIHHCMRCIGAAERALELMCARAASRTTFGQPVSERANVQDWIAESRIEIDMARLLTLRAAWLMDTVGNKAARMEISAIKVAAPNVALKVIDRAIQVHGGGGVSDDFPLASMYAHLRTLRLADGPDEVHKRSIARMELRRAGDPRSSSGLELQVEGRLGAPGGYERNQRGDPERAGERQSPSHPRLTGEHGDALGPAARSRSTRFRCCAAACVSSPLNSSAHRGA